MKMPKINTSKVTVNPNLRSNPNDPVIQKKIEKATVLLSKLKHPIV